jgi:hypothetical protein
MQGYERLQELALQHRPNLEDLSAAGFFLHVEELTVTLVENFTHPTLHAYTSIFHLLHVWMTKPFLSIVAVVRKIGRRSMICLNSTVFGFRIGYIRTWNDRGPTTSYSTSRCTYMYSDVQCDISIIWQKFCKRKDVSNTHSTGGTLLTENSILTYLR